MSSKEADSLLGKEVEYQFTYNPGLLFPISRSEGRDRIPVDTNELPFKGIDIWTGFEVSWLNAKGKPIVRVAEFEIPADSPNLVESKSFKLYLNSFNQTQFDDETDVIATMEKDLSHASGGQVKVAMFEADSPQLQCFGFDGECVDDLDIDVDVYEPDATLLKTSENTVTEILNSHLLRSNCPVTGQPDWGTLVVEYTGKKLDREAFLKYVISYRQHTGFHEQCVEQAFVDLKAITQATDLLVYARYLRRGGLDINPYRSMDGRLPKVRRHHRQ